jgi:hypothetical protein
MTVEYMPDGFVSYVLVTKPPKNPSVSGYGAKIPTRFLLQCSDGMRRRVYMMQYSNSGSAYVLVRGSVLHLSIEAEYMCEQAAKGSLDHA